VEEKPIRIAKKSYISSAGIVHSLDYGTNKQVMPQFDLRKSLDLSYAVNQRAFMGSLAVRLGAKRKESIYPSNNEVYIATDKATNISCRTLGDMPDVEIISFDSETENRLAMAA